MNSLRQIITTEISNPSKYTKMVFKSLANKPERLIPRLGKNANSVMLESLKGQVFETHNLFGKVNKKAQFHGVALSEAVLGFSRNGKNKTFMLTENGLVIEREVKKDVQKGLMQIDYFLKDLEQRLLSFKRKTVSFETDGNKFLKKKNAVVETLENKSDESFTNAVLDKNATPLLVSLPNQAFSKMHDIKDIEKCLKTFFGDTVSKILKPENKLRKAIQNEFKDISQVHSIYKSELNFPLPLYAEIKKTKPSGKSIQIKTDNGVVKESHNVFHKKASYWGIPMPESIMTFSKNPVLNTGILLENGVVINRIIEKNPKKGIMNIHYHLQKTINGKVEMLGEMVKAMRFEVENGKFKRLLNKDIMLIDIPEQQGFRHYLENAGKDQYMDTRGLSLEVSEHVIMKNLVKKLPQSPTKTLFNSTIKRLDDMELSQRMN